MSHNSDLHPVRHCPVLQFQRLQLHPRDCSGWAGSSYCVVDIKRTLAAHYTYLLSSSGCRRRRMRGCFSRARMAASWRSNSVTTSRRRGLCSFSANLFSNRNTAASYRRCHNNGRHSNIGVFILFIQFINQQWHRSTSNGTEVQTKNILAERPTQD